MQKVILLDDDDHRRSGVEDFIKTVYLSQYGAVIEAPTTRLISLLNCGRGVMCAASLRSDEDGFFSERYLDVPIDQVLSAISGRLVARHEIFEVSTLSSCAPRSTARFIREIVAYGETRGFAWSFFTLTRRLYGMLERLGFALTFLAKADGSRIADAHRWGDYYATDPGVYAIASDSLSARVGRNLGMECHASAL
ncbi:thermostable hemolysin [Lichenifustis flavocetrariae]|uniref:Thermostable hemolysin n=1 Tax=Lichenifustis flavocetrariae TaxID=2949735 RepID=A0AA41Z238_9HYPH|nr:thermostable hemolysin [Lichenifustis flavocetrariae]MCW6512816.1 thermostable hemolysin [Lichenifustis flavocetrariae]